MGTMEAKLTTEHQRMIWELCCNPQLLMSPLGLTEKIWIRGTELPIGEDGERIDLVFYERWDPWKTRNRGQCFIVELKSDQANHEVVGQLEKAKRMLTPRETNICGVAIAKEFTNSGLYQLRSSGNRCLLWGHGSLKEVGTHIKMPTS